MRLSLDVIRDELKRQFDFADPASEIPYAMELRAAAVLTSEPPEPHTLYVAEARRLPVHWKFSGHVKLPISEDARWITSAYWITGSFWC